MFLVLGIFVVVLFNYFKNNSPGYRLVGRHDTTPEIVSETKNSQPKTLTLAVVGDIMAHRPVVQSAYDSSIKQYDFSSILHPVAQYLTGDMVLGNMETPVAGDEKGFPGYPMFNAPVDYLKSLRSAGFTHLSVANNHSLDQHFTGLQSTVKNISDTGIVPIGFRDNPEHHQIIMVTSPSGLRAGIFAGTYGFNGFQLPADKQYTVMNYSESELTEIETEITNRKNEFDVLIAYLHIGDEYQLKPNTDQGKIAQRLCDAGVRIIIMSHPHVLQPIKYITPSNNQSPLSHDSGEGLGVRTDNCLVAYSMGNFISNQQQLYTDLGGILQIQMTSTDGVLNIVPTFISTVVHRDRTDGRFRYQILPLNMTEKPSWMSQEKWGRYVERVEKIK
jgi:poly-gamma-glutamate capsule biosynthesis protein CapA/YwtB (metallophosphatase superfamily)